MHSTKLFGATLLCAAMIATTAPALASDDPDAPTATESVKAVESVDERLLVEPVTENAAGVNVPEEAGGLVDFEDTDFAIGLPGDENSDATRRGNSIVFVGTDEATSTVVNPTPSGVQIMTVLDSAAADTSPSYELNLPAGGTAQAMPDGSILITGADGTPIVAIAAPWAQDATGRNLPTHYTLIGNHLTQHIDTRGAAFPVVADPHLSLGRWIYVRFDRKETKRIAKSPITGKIKYASLLCAVYSELPFIAGACAVLSYDIAQSIQETFAKAQERRKCVMLGFNYAPLDVVKWEIEEC